MHLHCSAGLFLRSHGDIRSRECNMPCTPFHRNVRSSRSGEITIRCELMYYLPFFCFYSRLLYPCMDKVEDQVSTTSSPVHLQDDAIRIAGACLLAISICSIGILAQLLSCSHHGSDVGVDNESRDIFFSRSLFCIQGELDLQSNRNQ